MKRSQHITLGISIGSLMFAGSAVAGGSSRDRSAPPAPDQPDPPAASGSAGSMFYNALTGIYADDVNLDAAPLATNMIVVYQHNFGIYPYIRGDNGVHVNGGVPQNINLNEHLRQLAIDIERYIPDPDYDGFVAIDYEEWTPFWDDSVERYREHSRAMVRQNNPGMDDAQVERQAKTSFESKAKRFMKRTLEKCQALRPNAKWGYWSYPKKSFEDNNANWLWDRQDAFFPDVYMPYQLIPDGQARENGEMHTSWFVEDRLEGRVGFARELAGDRPVLAFAYPRYEPRNTNQWIRLTPLNEHDMTMSLEGPFQYGADGVVLWENIPQPGVVDAFQELFDSAIAPEMVRILADHGVEVDESVIASAETDETDTSASSDSDAASDSDTPSGDDEPSEATRRATRRGVTRFGRQSRGGGG